MGIINQPHKANLGDKLRELLSLQGEFSFDNFYVIVAYVKKSGVMQIKESVEFFRKNGGNIKVVAGIDQKNSSLEGISNLFEISDELYLYHSESLMQTFHPKLYILEKKDKKAIVFIGSNNMTGGGLFTNYEACYFIEFDLTLKKDKEDFFGVKEMFNFYSNTSSDCCKKVSKEFIQELTNKGYITNEDNLFRQMRKVTRDLQLPKRERIFGSETFKIKRTIQKSRKEIIEEELDLINPIEIPEAFNTKGNLIWKKENLPSSDVQRVSGTTNITGVLRLSQARFKINNELVNHTTYFINEVFGRLDWTTEYRKNKQPLLVAFARFQINILGKYKGEYELKISHDPERIAGQDNVPTTLHWGNTINIIKEKTLTGKNLFLYAPSKDTFEPYYIEIN